MNWRSAAEMLMTSALRRMRGDLERRPRARARLDEKIHQRFAAQSRHLFDLAGADFLERICRVEKKRDLLRRELADPEKVFPLPAHLGFRRSVIDRSPP